MKFVFNLISEYNVMTPAADFYRLDIRVLEKLCQSDQVKAFEN